MQLKFRGSSTCKTSWQDDILEGKQGSLSFREWFPNLSKVNEMMSTSLAG